MTKTLIQLSQRLLAKFIGLNEIPVTGRILSPDNLRDEEKALSNLIPGRSFISSSGARCFIFSYEQDSYMAISIYLSDEHTASLSEQSQNEIVSIDPIGSHYLYLADKLSLAPIKIGSDWIEENIAGPARDEGVSLETLKDSLEPLSVFRLSLNSSVPVNLPYLYLANYICTFETSLSQSTTVCAEAIDVIRELFLREKLQFFGQNLFHALAAKSLRHSFLEVYRLLEFTFILPRADDLIKALHMQGENISLPLLDFAKHCSEMLGWHRQERDSIERIFRDYARHDLDTFKTLARSCRPFSSIAVTSSIDTSVDDMNDFIAAMARRYYALRNQVAHQVWPEKEHDCDTDDWNVLILFTLQSIRWIYDKHLVRTP